MKSLLSVFTVAVIAALANPAAAADNTHVATPRGVSAKLGKDFFSTVKRRLIGKVTQGPALKAVKQADRAAALAQAATKAKVQYAVDMYVDSKKKMSVLVVTAGGDIIFDNSSTLPKQAAKQKVAIIDVATEAAAAIKSQEAASEPAAAPTPVAAPTMPTAPADGSAQAPAAAAGDGATTDPFAEGAAPPWMATSPSAPRSATPMPTSTTETSSEAAAKESSKSKGKRDGGGRGDFRIAIAPLAGAYGYKEHIDTSRDQGDRDVKVSLAPAFGGQLELEHAVGFRLTAQAAKQSATLKPDITDPTDITIDQMFVNGRASFALTSGELPIAIAAGGSYEKLDAGSQVDVLWVPSSKMIGTFLGLTLSSGDLTTVGFTFEGGAGVVPYGKHTRTADAVEVSSRALGGQGWLRGRYQIPKLLGSSAGVFFELGGQLRYLSLTPGSVTLPAEDGTVRTLSLPAGDEKSNRFDYGLGLSIGLMWRPGD